MIVKWCRVPEGVFSHICVAEIVVIVQVAPVSSNQNNKDPLLALCGLTLPLPFLGHRAEHWVVPTDRWAVLIVLCFGVANLVELGLKLITIYPWAGLSGYQLSPTVDANMLPPNQTAYLCIWCWMT